MDKSELELERFFNMNEWKKLLTSLSNAFGVAVGMFDYKGTPTFDAINTCEFCRAIISNPIGKKRCLKCMALGGLEAMRQNKPLVAYCHAGLTIGVVPIMVDEMYLGAVSFGQVLMTGESMEDRSSGILGERSRMEHDESEDLRKYLHELFDKVQVMDKEKFCRIADSMWNLLRYTVGRTVELKNEKQTYEWVLKNALAPLIDAQSAASPISVHESETASIALHPGNQLYPAVQYIDSHPEEAVSMHDMAELCHLSHSYFSKLWLRDMGENFTNYVNRKKAELAKQRLLNSSDSISFIASSLGYSDTSYFIKVFKKVEGITPLAYRQHKYLQK